MGVSHLQIQHRIEDNIRAIEQQSKLAVVAMQALPRKLVGRGAGGRPSSMEQQQGAGGPGEWHPRPHISFVAE
jgi:hypothetical protein